MVTNTINKEFYKREEKGLAPIFHQSWWLNLVCQKGSWDVCLARKKDGKTIGSLPFYLTSFLGCKVIRTPPFTPFLGVWIDYSAFLGKKSVIKSFENEVVNFLVNQLPNVAWYHQIHPEQLTNWLPFYWKGYRQTTRYTYVLEDLNLERIYAEMKPEVRTRIRKAETLYKIVENNNFEVFSIFYNRNMKRQGLSLKKNKKILELLHVEIQARKAGEIYYAVDENSNTVAALYLIWDKETAYYWLPCLDKELRS